MVFKPFVIFIVLTVVVDLNANPESSHSQPWEHNPSTKRAIERGLEYVVKTQAKNGSWTQEGYAMAMTSLNGLALLSAGNTPERGKYRKNLRAALYFVLNQTRSRSFKASGLITTSSEERPMYGHGFAVLFLAQVYGTTANRKLNTDIRIAIRRGVQLISKSQSREGGWYYSPDSYMDEGSVTIHQIQALRASQNVGITVKKSVIDKALKYLEKCQNSDGGIRYSASSGGPSSLALTVAGLACYYNCGVYDGKSVRQLTKFIKNRMYLNKKVVLTGGERNWHLMYTQHYASQAIFFQGGQFWKDYFQKMSKYLISRQENNGSWSGSPGPVYSTPVGIMILTLPYRYLPINQR